MCVFLSINNNIEETTTIQQVKSTDPLNIGSFFNVIINT
jgi:hypothetical protein